MADGVNGFFGCSINMFDSCSANCDNNGACQCNIAGSNSSDVACIDSGTEYTCIWYNDMRQDFYLTDVSIIDYCK